MDMWAKWQKQKTRLEMVEAAMNELTAAKAAQQKA
jgi:hypothetical protein